MEGPDPSAGPGKHQGHGMKYKPNQVSKETCHAIRGVNINTRAAVRPQHSTNVAV